MKFSLNLFEHQVIEQINGREYGRVYKTLAGNIYPSITNVLGSTKEGDFLQTWIEKVGQEEADRICARAANRGTDLHLSAEEYISNRTPNLSKATTRRNFQQIQRYLDRMQNIRGIEIPLYSNRIKIAGTADCIAEYDGVLSVIDYKTSRTLKKREWITDYFLQGTFYAIACSELYKVLPQQVVIIMATDDQDPGIFIEPIKNHVSELVKRRKKFDEMFQI